jgi:purine-binding chemotaxis protein CheW
MDEQVYISFTLDQEEYAIELNKVKEVVRYKKILGLPNTDPCIRGVINLRGIIIPVIDLRAKFGMQPSPYTKFTVILVLEISNKTMGLIIDSVPDVVLLRPKELQPPPTFKSLINEKYIQRIGRKASRLIAILDTEQIVLTQEASDNIDPSYLESCKSR